jgi:cysteine desulfurase/selenocysteine lyase
MVEFDVERIRRDFPVLATSVNNKPLVYLDSGASAQMPQSVIDRINHYHQYEHSPWCLSTLRASDGGL